jgi:hypothetical protein
VASPLSPAGLSPAGLSPAGRRRLAAGLLGLAALPVAVLVGCADSNRDVGGDQGPDPKGSNPALVTVTPGPVPPEVTTASVAAPRTGSSPDR